MHLNEELCAGAVRYMNVAWSLIFSSSTFAIWLLFDLNSRLFWWVQRWTVTSSQRTLTAVQSLRLKDGHSLSRSVCLQSVVSSLSLLHSYLMHKNFVIDSTAMESVRIPPVPLHYVCHFCNHRI